MYHNRRRQAFDIKKYADPTDEVFFANDGMSKVRYVVYKSSIPSIEAVNRQLAEKKRAASLQTRTLRRQGCGGNTGSDDDGALRFGEKGAQEQKRRALLSELRQCNAEQLQRKQLEAELKASQLKSSKRLNEAQSYQTESVHDACGPTEDEYSLSTAHRDASCAVRTDESQAGHTPHNDNKEIVSIRSNRSRFDDGLYDTHRSVSSQQRHACDNMYRLDLLQDAEKTTRAAAKRKAREYMEANRILAERAVNERRQNAIRERQSERSAYTAAPSLHANPANAMPPSQDDRQGGMHQEHDTNCLFAGKLGGDGTRSTASANPTTHVDATAAAAAVAPCASANGALTALSDAHTEAALRSAQTSRDVREANLRLMERKREKLHRDREEERNWARQAEATAMQLERKLHECTRGHGSQRERVQDERLLRLPSDAQEGDCNTRDGKNVELSYGHARDANKNIDAEPCGATLMDTRDAAMPATRQRLTATDGDGERYFRAQNDQYEQDTERRRRERLFRESLCADAEQARARQREKLERERATERAVMHDLEEQWRLEQNRTKAKELAKQQDLRRGLDEQIAYKSKNQESARAKQRRAGEQPRFASCRADLCNETFIAQPDVETRVLYRCPVTGKLLPANAF